MQNYSSAVYDWLLNVYNQYLVTMLAPKETPQDYHCKDKFLIQSVVVEEGTATKDIVSDTVYPEFLCT
jgi:hypothetical protein